MRNPDLQAIRQRVAAASSSPWLAATDNNRKNGIGIVGRTEGRGTGQAIAVFAAPDSRQRNADAEFTANARQDIPELLGALDEAHGQIVSLIACAERLHPSEQYSVMRSEGCGYCGGSHLAELSELVTGSQAPEQVP